jgi:predicted CXXCH cytochrome family protein
MQPANEQTVLGDFSGATFTYFGRTSTFYREGERFVVRTEGPDGSDQDFDIQYTFGVTPLQQYLIEFPGGRLQALGIAWDARPLEEGGQRWFHLYPDDNVEPGDRLHWTGRDQTWNYQCADCHSTNLEKNYDLETDTYATSWSEIDVGCESCHGPGSEHLEWARRAGDDALRASDVGLTVDLSRRGQWRFAEGDTVARLDSAPPPNVEIATCAPCHSRRQMIDDQHPPGAPPLDGMRVALLEPGLYHPDGQILEEVYVYGSFVQSRMHSAGVTCSDCHDPHALNVRSAGNALCSRCHQSAAYDTPAHHFHEPESTGASCVECHMPATTYMVNDPRRDHSIRVPRPHLSVQLGTPNACTDCHTDRSADWAAGFVDLWYESRPDSILHYGEILAQGRDGVPSADRALSELVAEPTIPGVVRASALVLLGGYASQWAFQAIQRGLQDTDPLVRFGAARAAQSIPPEQRYELLYPLLRDSLRVVRNEAARALASVPPNITPERQRAAIDSAVVDYIASQMADADRPEAHLNIGLAHLARGSFDEAEASYRTALQLDSTFVPAYVNLAELRRTQGRDSEGESFLQRALDVDPDDGSVHHAVGLLRARQQRQDEAVTALRRAAELAPENARFSYVYAIALDSYGDRAGAIGVLVEAADRHPYDLDILTAIISINRERGDLDAAITAAERLLELLPDDPRARQLLTGLRAER